MSSIDELLAAAEADVTRGWLPACQVAVARDGKLAAFATFGDATDDTRFAVFSATKPIVAAAAWVLMGEGLLDVARPVADYVPEFATHGKHAVTVEQVMLHTAGFPSPTLLAEGADPVMRAAASPSGRWSGSRGRASSTTACRPTGCWPS
jgi:CubicO group peptidase (beta-lactamase class C family)